MKTGCKTVVETVICKMRCLRLVANGSRRAAAWERLKVPNFSCISANQ